MAERVEILRIEVDRQQASEQLVTTEQQLAKLRQEQARYKKELKDSNGTNKAAAQQLVATQNQIKKTTQTHKDLTNAVRAEKGSLNELKATLSRLTAERNKVDQTTRAGAKRFHELNKEILRHNNVIRAAEEAGGDFRRSVGNYSTALEGIPGPAGAVVTSIKRITTAALAFIATPLGAIIGAIVLALAALREYFKGSEEGANQLTKIMNALGVVFGNVMDVLRDFGEVVFNAISKPKEAWNDFVDSVVRGAKFVGRLLSGDISAWSELAVGIEKAIDKGKEFIEETRREIEVSNQLSDALAAADKRERENLIKNAERRRDIAKLRLTDRANEEERIKALEQAIELENEILNDELEIAVIRRDAAIEFNNQADSATKKLEEQAAAEAKVFEIQQQNLTRQKELSDELNALIAKGITERQALRDKEREKELQESFDAVKDMIEVIDQERERSRIFIGIRDEEADAAIFAKRKEELRKNQITRDAAAMRMQIAEQERELNINAALSIASAFTGLLKQSSAEFRVAKSAEALMSAYMAINKTLAEPTLPFPANVLTSIAIGVQALGNVAKINSIGFAEGGFIGNRGVALTPNQKGDNRLILAKDDEVILNSRQQARIGASTLSRAGVPGFADGGLVRAVSEPALREADNVQSMMSTFRKMPAPVVSVVEINKGQNNVRVKERISRM